MSLRKWLAPSITALALAGSAAAQDVTRSSATRLQFGDWTFVAVVARSGDTATVPGILAMRDTSYAVGSNIVSVWYENPGNCTGWEAKAWTTPSQAEAVKFLKDTYGISDDWDWLWPTSDQLTQATQAATPSEYQSGLLLSDPLFSIVSQPGHQTIVTILTVIGYRAADIAPEQPDQPCPLNELLCGFASSMAYAIGTPDVTEEQFNTYFNAAVPLACVGPGQPGGGGGGGTPWTPPGWPVTTPGPAWVSPPDDPGTFNPFCATTQSCCYTFYIRYYYWDFNWLGLLRMYYCKTPFSLSCPNPSGGPCPAVPSCAGGPPYAPAPGATPVCGYHFY